MSKESIRELDELILRQHLERALVKVPNQERVAVLREAASLGFDLIDHKHIPEWRVRHAWKRRFTRWNRIRTNNVRRRDHEWKVFTYADYVARRGGSEEYGGGLVPNSVRLTVRKLRTIPGVSIYVEALYKDPWLVVVYGMARLYLRCWMTEHLVV